MKKISNEKKIVILLLVLSVISLAANAYFLVVINGKTNHGLVVLPTKQSLSDNTRYLLSGLNGKMSSSDLKVAISNKLTNNSKAITLNRASACGGNWFSYFETYMDRYLAILDKYGFDDLDNPSDQQIIDFVGTMSNDDIQQAGAYLAAAYTMYENFANACGFDPYEN